MYRNFLQVITFVAATFSLIKCCSSVYQLQPTQYPPLSLCLDVDPDPLIRHKVADTYCKRYNPQYAGHCGLYYLEFSNLESQEEVEEIEVEKIEVEEIIVRCFDPTRSTYVCLSKVSVDPTNIDILLWSNEKCTKSPQRDCCVPSEPITGDEQSKQDYPLADWRYDDLSLCTDSNSDEIADENCKTIKKTYKGECKEMTLKFSEFRDPTWTWLHWPKKQIAVCSDPNDPSSNEICISKVSGDSTDQLRLIWIQESKLFSKWCTPNHFYDRNWETLDHTITDDVADNVGE